MKEHTTIKWRTFLKDVFICSLGAYGGPEAHYGVFTDQMVVKKQYLNENELIELIALTGVLPGPSSTQTLIAIGYKVGGPILAFLTFLVWALPAIVVMTLFSFLSQLFSDAHWDYQWLRYIGPMAVGFIVLASFRIGKKVIKKPIHGVLFLMGAVLTYFFRQVWVFPTLLLVGGVVSVALSKTPGLWNKITVIPPWKYFVIFLVIAIGSTLLNQSISNRLVFLFTHFFQYGYLVIGGGQVVVPYMFSDLVEIHQFMSSEAFLIGFGLVQGIPGPMFSFAAYAGGMAMNSFSSVPHVLGGILSGIAIFLPGILLIFFVYPIWSQVKQIKAIQLAIPGITSVAAGLIATSAVVLMQSNGFSLDNILVLIGTVGLLWIKKIPAPLIVVLMVILGIIL